MIAVLFEEKQVGHAGDVIADDDVAGNNEGLLFVVGRHGIGFGEKETEQLFQAFDRMVAVVGDERVGIEMGNEELLKAGILFGEGGGEFREASGIAADFVDGSDTGISCGGGGRFDQIG